MPASRRCFVLELRDHPHNLVHAATVMLGGIDEPAPAARFDRTRAPSGARPERGADGDEAPPKGGWNAREIEHFARRGPVSGR